MPSASTGPCTNGCVRRQANSASRHAACAAVSRATVGWAVSAFAFSASALQRAANSTFVGIRTLVAILCSTSLFDRAEGSGNRVRAAVNAAARITSIAPTPNVVRFISQRLQERDQGCAVGARHAAEAFARTGAFAVVPQDR